MDIRPITLQGRHVTLEPLSHDHLMALCEVGLEPDLWQLTLVAVKTPEDMRAYIDAALAMQMEGASLPFAIIERQSRRAIGSTRFGNIDRTNRRVEIGWTWVGQRWLRTAVNTETKYLLLTHAFESWRCVRVEFKTDLLNTRSRTGLARIGAKEEGILRRHYITHTGRIRDTVYYSIIDSEWPNVKASLEQKLHAHR